MKPIYQIIPIFSLLSFAWLHAKEIKHRPLSVALTYPMSDLKVEVENDVDKQNWKVTTKSVCLIVEGKKQTVPKADIYHLAGDVSLHTIYTGDIENGKLEARIIAITYTDAEGTSITIRYHFNDKGFFLRHRIVQKAHQKTPSSFVKMVGMKEQILTQATVKDANIMSMFE